MTHFIQELKDRHVIKAGVAYLAVAWIVIQLIGEIGPILGAPEWVYKTMLALLAGGFIVTLILAWVYELTNKGLRRASEIDKDDQLHAINDRQLDFVIIGALAIALGYFIWESRFSEDVTSVATVQSIAVLPFRDMSADRNQEYFAEGMAEELINALSRIPDLKVAGRTSSFAYKDQPIDLAEIASQLSVSHILEGSIRTSGNQLRVTAKLIKAEDGFQIWTREFDRELSEIFAVQDEISELVLEGLKLHFGGSDDSTLPAEKTSVAAYDEFLLGRYHLARRTQESIVLAIGHFKAAIAHDQNYSKAYSGLSKTLAVSPYYMPISSPADIAIEARSAAETAIRLDSTNSEAFSALGLVLLAFERDWDAARDNLSRAIQLQPNDAGNNNLFGDYLYTVGDYVGARKYEGLAAQLEPLSATNQHELALVNYFLGDFDRAIELEQLAIGLNPEFDNALEGMARVFLIQGREDMLRALLLSERSLLGLYADRFEMQLSLQNGDRATAARLAADIARQDAFRELSHAAKSHFYALLGDDQNATHFFEIAYKVKDPIIISPLFFFLPEDWPALPLLQEAMKKDDLARLYDLRRQNIAAGTGRNFLQSD